MMSHWNLVLFISITVVFCHSEARIPEILDCIFSSAPQDGDFTFSQIFMVSLESNDKLLHQFNVSIPPKECYELAHKFTLDVYTKLHASDPSKIADVIAETSQYKYQGLPPKDMANFVAKSLEQILKKQGVLKKENTIQLVLNFVNYLNSFRNLPGYDGSPQSNLSSLYYSVLPLLLINIPASPKNANMIAETFENNLLALPDRVPHAPALDNISLKIKDNFQNMS